jgi:hypothetical protein
MEQSEAVIEQIRAAFRDTPFPGDAFLQGSFEGCEPYDEVSQFHGRNDWTALDPAFLDARYCALSFFSDAGFRFFLPAYMVADLQGRLLTADPVFHLTHGFFAFSSEHDVDGRVFVRHFGPRVFLNPLRYGAMTWSDHARHRLSVFTREEAQAIVAYLRCRRSGAEADLVQEQVGPALDAFWLERAATAPTAEALARHQAEEALYAAAIKARVARSMPAAAMQPRGDGSCRR